MVRGYSYTGSYLPTEQNSTVENSAKSANISNDQPLEDMGRSALQKANEILLPFGLVHKRIEVEKKRMELQEERLEVERKQMEIEKLQAQEWNKLIATELKRETVSWKSRLGWG